MSNELNPNENEFTRLVCIQFPAICGAMYPCSNPELVAAASEAGGIGIVQPISLTYVYGYEYREGLRRIRDLTSQPIGVNMLVEGSNATYRKRLDQWMDISLEEGVRFFVTALGNPRWVVDKANQVGGIVFHDVTNVKHARKALDNGVDGFICVNDRAGGHAGELDPRSLFDEIAPLGKPTICAGGVADREGFHEALDIGYLGVQMGTRFIASREAEVHADYKDAIIEAKATDIVLTDKISGVPVSVINTPYIQRMGLKAGWLARKMLQGRRTKHWMRSYYMLVSLLTLKKSNLKGASYKKFFQAGKSVEKIDNVMSVAEIYDELRNH
ncbi:Nitronate monooxygenase [Rubripirellula tenax]|uniref:Nitronate monooxygenase n=1 Tax=Rubripirellula tenax TaxID=2528015 RepID=A0A5C6FLB9_9BACT|nr:nitronate monooxygenase [Rubripirellula tenax]TWU60807.1 Nitronate monooxygenase [Rubripirellula tenax]